MSVSEVFRHESMDELLLSLIDKRINELSFEGLATIEEYYRKSFGLELVPHAQNRQLLMLAIASRNLLVHRRGVIDERYIRATASIERKGTRLRIARLVWPELIPVLLETVRDIDCRAAQKFGFQSALVISGNEVASMQEAFFDSVKREVLEWRT